jgi:hypothetical protein
VFVNFEMVFVLQNVKLGFMEALVATPALRVLWDVTGTPGIVREHAQATSTESNVNRYVVLVVVVGVIKTLVPVIAVVSSVNLGLIVVKTAVRDVIH